MINWPNIEEKLRAIGFLSIPGVISAIEATVPKGKTDKFCREFSGHYSPEYPYEADKYGYQFRIYLGDTEGCPPFLYDQLDERYKCRINDTSFIKELVLDYGFKFTREPQDHRIIARKVKRLHGEDSRYFLQGYHVYDSLISDIVNAVRDDYNAEQVMLPDIPEERRAGRRARRSANPPENTDVLSLEQRLLLGWMGEAYFYQLLLSQAPEILDLIGIRADQIDDIEWFNEGIFDEETPRSYLNPRIVKSTGEMWEDQSVGRGCDIVVTDISGRELLFEVKSSKSGTSFFSMTSNEMQTMERELENYYLVRLNYMERLADSQPPELQIIQNPFEVLFHPSEMKSAEFVLRR